jgi:hypothetical protein
MTSAVSAPTPSSRRSDPAAFGRIGELDGCTAPNLGAGLEPRKGAKIANWGFHRSTDLFIIGA